MNQSVVSDPSHFWQIRQKGKILKALSSSKVALYGDHVELSDEGRDLTSTVGFGGVIGTIFVLRVDVHINMENVDESLIPDREENELN